MKNPQADTSRGKKGMPQKNTINTKVLVEVASKGRGLIIMATFSTLLFFCKWQKEETRD